MDEGSTPSYSTNTELIKLKVMDTEKMVKEMKEWAESEKGLAYFQKLTDEQAMRDARHRRFEEWLKTNDFDKLIYRLILEHNDDYIDKCYHNGYMPFPNRKLAFVIGYVVDNLAPISVPQLENMFPTEIRFFKGYYFRIMHGQGSVFDLYNGDDFKHLLST